MTVRHVQDIQSGAQHTIYARQARNPTAGAAPARIPRPEGHRSLAGLAARLLSRAGAPGPAGGIGPGVAGGADPVELGPGGGQVTLGAFGPLALLGAGFLEDLGAGVEHVPQFFPLARAVGAGPAGRIRHVAVTSEAYRRNRQLLFLIVVGDRFFGSR